MQANETSRMANTERIAKSPIPNSASQRNGVDLVTSPVTKKKIHRYCFLSPIKYIPIDLICLKEIRCGKSKEEKDWHKKK